MSALHMDSPDNLRSESAPKLKALFVSPGRWVPFIDQDIETLSKEYSLEVLYRPDFASRRQLLLAVSRQLLSARNSLVYIWFAEPYDTPFIVLLARLFRVPSVIAIGGYELVSMPEVGYGAITRRRDRMQLACALRLAHTLLPTSEFLARELRRLGHYRRIQVMPPDIDCSYFRPSAGERERLVVTVARVTEAQWQVKGLDVFASVSALLPDISFAILGPCESSALSERLRNLGGPNLLIPGENLLPEQLLRWYQRATVYAQLSARESLGVALGEAMASSCRPVASDVAALPDLVGESGALVPYG
ncbi:MAG: glycosyltransferase family 4 protein, partial [bacterium]|nr:glycosyltransferase family 4 protein [bacterium]